MGVKVPELTPECLAFLEQYPWPGNIRQLENALYRAVSLLDDDTLGIEHLQLPSFTNDLGADSLDTVELIMEFEKEFNIAIPDDQAEKIGTVGDAVNYITENAK